MPAATGTMPPGSSASTCSTGSTRAPAREVELVRVERVIAVTIAVVRASGGLSSSSLPTGRADRADDIPAFVDKMLEEFTEGKDAEQHAVSQATG